MHRFFDILISLIALLFLLPLLASCIFILRYTGEKKYFFYKKELESIENPFMSISLQQWLKIVKILVQVLLLKNDSRVLPFGKFLRKTKMNELPQLFNILKGDMSIIGPRP